eukprot:Awhi_evm1s14918
MNTGVFFIKNSGWSRRFLEQIYFSHQKSIKNINIWWEQAVIIKQLALDYEVANKGGDKQESLNKDGSR